MESKESKESKDIRLVSPDGASRFGVEYSHGSCMITVAFTDKQTGVVNTRLYIHKGMLRSAMDNLKSWGWI